MATTTTGPGDVTAAARAARATLEAVSDAGGVCGSRAEWAEALTALQQLVDVAAAAQDAAIVRLAAIEPVELEDGTQAESHRTLGHVALDAPAIVSGVLTLTSVNAERRVRHAVRTAADGPDGTITCTGLGGLHAAMAAGRLDAHRAQVVAHELEECPSEVARTVVATLEPHLDRDDATRLRSRVRRVLARISPDLLRQRSVRARAESGLRRWVDEPGVDTWLGTFPSEEACTAWAAVDALAQQYVTDGTCDRIDRARAKALTDLVTGNATIDLQVHVVAAADAPEPDRRTGTTGEPGDLVAVHGPVPGEPVLVARDWLEQAIAATTSRADRYGRVALHPSTGALTSGDDDLASDGYRPGARISRLVRARDGHCRFPGCHVAARFCDLDHVTPWPAGPTTASNLACLCRRHHRTKQRPGWRATLHPDATMTWTDPTGRTRTTHPVDHRPLTLPDTRTDHPPPPGNPRLDLPDGPHSALEHHLEHGLTRREPPCRTGRVEIRRPPRPVHVSGLRPARARARPAAPIRPPF